MNLGCGVKSMTVPSSSASWKSGVGVSDKFPVGVRVLVVDDDPTCLNILEKMLQTCLYEVAKCNRAEVALSLLRENKNGFDIVISDVHMPDMDGLKLLELVGLEMDLPVIMMSADDRPSVVMKGVTHGACDYLIKPVYIEALKNIWRHVVRKRKHEWKEFDQSGSVEEERQQKPTEDTDYLSSANEGNCRNSERRKDKEDEVEDRDDPSTLKRPRLVWSVELHQLFVASVNHLGIDKAVPRKILDLMNVPGLTRENVAGHLQKYRLYLRKLSGVSQHHTRLNNSFMGRPDGTYESISSFNGLDLQALAAAGQLPPQNLAISLPLVDQRNLFSFENQQLRFGEGPQQQLNNSNKQMNLLHGIPTYVGPKQLASLHQSAPSFGGMNLPVNSHVSQGSSLLVHTAQPLSRSQLNETNGNNVSRLKSSIRQPIMPKGVGSGRNGMEDNFRETVYSLVSQAYSMVDLSTCHCTDLQGNTFPLGNNSGMPNLPSKGLLQDEVNSEIKGLRGFVPSYDSLNELHQQKSQGWGLQNIGFTFDASQHGNVQGGLDMSPSILVQQCFLSNENSMHNRNASFGNTMLSAGEDGGHLNTPNIDQCLHNIGDNSVRVKIERPPETSSINALFSDQFGQEDLMSALRKPVNILILYNKLQFLFNCLFYKKCYKIYNTFILTFFFFDFEQQLNNSNKQMNLLHGIPTYMEPKQIASLHQSAPSFGGMNFPVYSHVSQGSSLLVHMAQPQSRSQLNETSGNNVSRHPSSIGQPIMSNGVGSGVLAWNGMAGNVRGTVYSPVSQASSKVDFSTSHSTDLQCNTYLKFLVLIIVGLSISFSIFCCFQKLKFI